MKKIALILGLLVGLLLCFYGPVHKADALDRTALNNHINRGCRW